MLHRRIVLAAFPFLWLVLGVRPLQAQCFADGLDGGPCCSLTNAAVPYLPAFGHGAQAICWQDCGIDQVIVVKASWLGINQVPGTVPPDCGEQRMRLTLRNGANAIMWRGNLRLNYSRSWWAVDTNGLAFQVRRFLVNGDLTNFPAAGPAPCPVPPCAASFGNRTRYTGYLDFADDCGVPGGQQFSWMLTHACDAIDHHSGFARAGVFHPDRSYTFVGPGAGFIPGPLQPIEGTPSSGLDSLHQRVPTTAPVTYLCTFEEPLFHTLTPQNQLCFCGLPGAQFMIGDLSTQGLCGSAVRTPPVGPLLPGFVSMGIGSWTNPNVYPGQQALRWNVGGYDVVDGCTGVGSHLVYFGVTTFGGYQAFELVGGNPGNPMPMTFIDQASAQLPNQNTVMNRPYNSYHFMALNE